MPRLTVQFRGYEYGHQQMEALIRALVKAGGRVMQVSEHGYLHKCTIGGSLPAGPYAVTAHHDTRWKALAEAVRLLEQP